MPSKRFDTTWNAEPHTIAKIAILEAYLNAWFSIMGRSMAGKDIVYIDGFAGPGEYTNHPKGSPVAALNAATAALATTGRDWKAGNIHCVFIESDEKRFAHLQRVINSLNSHKRIKLYLWQAPFADGLSRFKTDSPLVFSTACPLFVFIDPFGAKGVPFSAIADILRSPCSEVLLNFDADGIVRIYRAQEDAKADILLAEVFGNDEWRTSLSGVKDFAILCRQVLNLYRRNLRQLPNIGYDFAFEMSSRSGSLNYYLVFASQHHLGLEKMKEAMKRVDQTGTYHFSDAKVSQPALFRFDAPDAYSPLMFGQFKGRTVQYAELRDFALNETPFINPKAMLKDLENKELIVVSSRDPKRRKGTFNEEYLIEIVFKGDMASAC